ncbi:HEPN domain-containing protein [bacterium]|nr:HEPN domain-containing protein [bacterium]
MSREDRRILVAHRLAQANTALGDAQHLLTAGRSAQSVINRAYYAMFYAVLALLQVAGLAPKKHSGAIALFDKEFVKRGIFPKDMSRDLHQAFDLRQEVDYLVLADESPERAQRALERAERFVAAVGAYLSAEGEV